MIDGNGNRAELRYDGHGRQDRWTFPSTTRPTAYNDATQATALASAGAINSSDYEEYAYDSNSNRTSVRKRDGSLLTYAFDKLNRLPSRPCPTAPGSTRSMSATCITAMIFGASSCRPGSTARQARA